MTTKLHRLLQRECNTLRLRARENLLAFERLDKRITNSGDRRSRRWKRMELEVESVRLALVSAEHFLALALRDLLAAECDERQQPLFRQAADPFLDFPASPQHFDGAGDEW